MDNLVLKILPPETWVMLLSLSGVLMIIGFRRAAFSLAMFVIALALFFPLLSAIPAWMTIIAMICGLMMLARFILGRRTTDFLVALLLHDIILLPFRLIGWLSGKTRRRI